jgi:hypothetical protein
MIRRSSLVAILLMAMTSFAGAATRTFTINSNTGDFTIDPVGHTFQFELPEGAFAPESQDGAMALVGNEIPAPSFSITHSATGLSYPFHGIHNFAGGPLYNLEFQLDVDNKIFIKLDATGLFDIGPPNDLPDGTQVDAHVIHQSGTTYNASFSSVTIGTVPEPSSMLLGLLSMLGAVAGLRRR